MTQKKNDSTITVVPPICAMAGEPHPRYVALTLPVELPLSAEVVEDVPEDDRVQWNFWSVVAHVSDDINRLANFNDAEHWPPGALTTAATCFLMADAALNQWRDGKLEECLVTAHAAQQAEARLAKILEEEVKPAPTG